MCRLLVSRMSAALDELLPEAFATVREASRRVLGMRHFDSQLVGESRAGTATVAAVVVAAVVGGAVAAMAAVEAGAVASTGAVVAAEVAAVAAPAQRVGSWSHSNRQSAAASA